MSCRKKCLRWIYGAFEKKGIWLLRNQENKTGQESKQARKRSMPFIIHLNKSETGKVMLRLCHIETNGNEIVMIPLSFFVHPLSFGSSLWLRQIDIAYEAHTSMEHPAIKLLLQSKEANIPARKGRQVITSVSRHPKYSRRNCRRKEAPKNTEALLVTRWEQQFQKRWDNGGEHFRDKL